MSCSLQPSTAGQPIVLFASGAGAVPCRVSLWHGRGALLLLPSAFGTAGGRGSFSLQPLVLPRGAVHATSRRCRIGPLHYLGRVFGVGLWVSASISKVGAVFCEMGDAASACAPSALLQLRVHHHTALLAISNILCTVACVVSLEVGRRLRPLRRAVFCCDLVSKAVGRPCLCGLWKRGWKTRPTAFVILTLCNTTSILRSVSSQPLQHCSQLCHAMASLCSGWRMKALGCSL